MPLSGLRGNLIAYDTETTGLNPWPSECFRKHGMHPARPFAFSFCDAEGHKAYIRWEVDPKTRKVVRNDKEAKAMEEVLADPNIVKVGHNISFDIRMTRLSGIKFDWGKVHDTMFLAHILTGGSLFNYGLKPMSEKWLGIDDLDQEKLLKSVRKSRLAAKKAGAAIAVEDTHGKKYVYSDMWLGDSELCRKYALLDAERTMLLYLGMSKELAREPGLSGIYGDEIRLMKVVYRMESRGVRVFPEKLKELRRFYSSYSSKWKRVAEANGGSGINFDSPAQLVNLFYVKRRHKVHSRTDTGKPSMDGAALLRLAKEDRLAKAILEYKASESMILKFINPYERFMAKKGGIYLLHPNFHQCGTNTGRFSCSDPNLQQAAVEDSAKRKADIGLKPREAIGVREGHVLYLPDFSQMEVWVFAFQAKDPVLTRALLSGEDLHSTVAKWVWGSAEDRFRKMGKTTMFLKLYGGTSKAMAELMGCSRDEAQTVLDEFDYKLPGVSAFIEQMSRKAEEQGYIENPFGRQSYIDRRYSYRAVNYLVQGTCADIVKRAMIRLDNFTRKNKLEVWMELTVHDELVIELSKKEHSMRLRENIIRIMQKDSEKIGIPVPMPIGMKMSRGMWAEAVKVEA